MLLVALVTALLLCSPAQGAGKRGISFAGVWGGWGARDGEFVRPHGIAVSGDGSRVYVADTDNGRVQYFGATGGYMGKFGWTGTPFDPANLHSPNDVAVDLKGSHNVYVADGTGNCVRYYTAFGTYLGQWGGEGSGNGQFDDAAGIALSPDGKRVYVADEDNHRIQYFSAAGDYEGQWGGKGSGNGQFSYPRGIAVSPDGARVYVADTYNARIQFFSADGVYQGQWGSQDPQFRGKLVEPHGIAVSPDGRRVYVADQLCGGFVFYYNASGVYQGRWGCNPVTGESRFNRPTDVAVSPDGSRVYVLDDWDNNRVHYFNVTEDRPVPKALSNTTVKRGKKAMLRYRVIDADNVTAQMITIKIYKGRKLRQTITLRGRATNENLVCSFRCTLSKGIYVWKVTATDPDGNKQVKASSRTLRVT